MPNPLCVFAVVNRVSSDARKFSARPTQNDKDHDHSNKTIRSPHLRRHRAGRSQCASPDQQPLCDHQLSHQHRGRMRRHKRHGGGLYRHRFDDVWPCRHGHVHTALGQCFPARRDNCDLPGDRRPAKQCPLRVHGECRGYNSAHHHGADTSQRPLRRPELARWSTSKCPRRDSCDSQPRLYCVPPSGSIFPIGMTTVICVAVDAMNNQSTATFPVIVTGDCDEDCLAISCPRDLEVAVRSGTSRVATFTVTATNRCGGFEVPVYCQPPSGSAFPLGTTTVYCTATNSGITKKCSFDVTVKDTTPPKITAPRVLTVPCQGFIQGQSSAPVSYQSPSRTTPTRPPPSHAHRRAARGFLSALIP